MYVCANNVIVLHYVNVFSYLVVSHIELTVLIKREK